MPFINTKINTSLTEEQKNTLKTRLGQAISLIPGKSENWLMVGFEDNYSLYFQGKSDTLIAYVEVKLFGKAGNDAYESLTKEICNIFQTELSVSPDKLYVKYEEVSHWGWNSTNF